jgi:hypothetical protein
MILDVTEELERGSPARRINDLARLSAPGGQQMTISQVNA